jgi:hypothetical protein
VEEHGESCRRPASLRTVIVKSFSSVSKIAAWSQGEHGLYKRRDCRSFLRLGQGADCISSKTARYTFIMNAWKQK